MPDNVIPFDQSDLSPEKVLERAKKRCGNQVIVIGSDESGELYFGSSRMDAANAVLLLEIAKKDLLEGY